MRFTLNGQAVSFEGSGARRLLDVLREELRATGTKEGCGEGECGACSVLIDGEVVDSCLVAVGHVGRLGCIAAGRVGVPKPARFQTAPALLPDRTRHCS